MTTYSANINEETPEEKLKKAKLLSRFIGWPSFLVSLAVIFLNGQLILATLSLLFPLLSIAALKVNRLVHLDDKKNSPDLSIASGFLWPMFCLGVLLYNQLSILSFNNLWAPSLALFVILALVLSTGNNSLNFSSGKGIGHAAMVLPFIYAYCFIAGLTVNCLYDKTTPAQYPVKVIDKYSAGIKTTKHYLIVEQWNPAKKSPQEKVSDAVYRRTQIGDTVTISYRPGILGAPWYTVY